MNERVTFLRCFLHLRKKDREEGVTNEAMYLARGREVSKERKRERERSPNTKDEIDAGSRPKFLNTQMYQNTMVVRGGIVGEITCQN